MKKSVLFLLLIALLFSVVACEFFYAVEDELYGDEYSYDDEYYDDEYYDDEEYSDDEYTDDEYADEAPTDSEPAPSANGEISALPQSDSSADCTNGETFHADVGLCYLDGGQAIPLFASMMDGVTEYADTIEEKLLDDEYTIVTYAVDGNEIYSPDYANVSGDLQAYQDDTATQEMIWHYYAAIIPQEARDMLVGYKVVSDGQGGSLAMVEQAPDDPTEWLLSVDIADTKDLRDLTYTLIHEYGHLLTLNENQLDIDENVFFNYDDDDIYYAAEESCATYFPGEGCAKSNAYIYLFYRDFWAGFYDEWSEIQYIEDDDDYYDALDNFYYKYEDQFVTDYAATNVGEDIAESWTFFIISEKPAGNSIAEEKILFFYQFPELVALREEMVARTYSRMIRMQ